MLLREGTYPGGAGETLRNLIIMANVLKVDRGGHGDGDGLENGALDVDVKDLEAELASAIKDGTIFVQQCQADYETRNCVWAGQSGDGRKRKDELGKEPFPWDGASDARIRLADEVVNDNVRVLRASSKRSILQTGPVESGDASESSAVTTYMKWLLYNKMLSNVRTELALLANWQEAYSVAVLWILWEREVRVKKSPLTLEELTLAVIEGGAQNPEELPQAQDMLNAIFDETREEEVAEWLGGFYEDMKTAQLKKAVRDLRVNAECTVMRNYDVKNLPEWKALRVFLDVFFPANTSDLQKARWVAVREPLSPVDLRARVLTEDYDESVVDEAVEKMTGKSVLSSIELKNAADARVIDDLAGMVEIIHFYRKVVDDDGLTNVKVTVYCPGVEEPLSDYLLDYEHQQYPGVAFCRDRTERLLLENRSVPSIVDTHQNEVKTQRDFRTDRTSVSILPALRVPMTRADSKIRFGPGVQIPERRPGEVSWMEPPRMDGETINIERQVRGDVDNFFGRASADVHPMRTAIYQEIAVDDWLGGLQEAAAQTMALSRQFHDDDLFERITGVRLPWNTSGEEIRGEYDLKLEFNAMDLNLEYVLKKLQVWKEIVGLDTAGVTDRAGLIAYMAHSLDPVVAAKVVQSAAAASEREVDDEELAVTKALNGIETEFKEGQNYELRLRVMDNLFAKNPKLMEKLATDEVAQGILQKRREHFQFQLQQRQNAQIGRMGAMPALGAPMGAGA